MDLHIYFWPVAARYLSDKGWFGFLTSSSWLDARYGFPLQRWALLNFRIHAVIESVDEPWFEDARVKTVVVLMQRCDEKQLRDKNIVRFVRLLRPLAEILGKREDEASRQQAAEHFRDVLLKIKTDFHNGQFRVLCKSQSDLWSDGQSVARMFAKQKELSSASAQPAEDQDDEDAPVEASDESLITTDYGGGKWGRYLRALVTSLRSNMGC